VNFILGYLVQFELLFQCMDLSLGLTVADHVAEAHFIRNPCAPALAHSPRLNSHNHLPDQACSGHPAIFRLH
jgi:hypothetical protein